MSTFSFFIRTPVTGSGAHPTPVAQPRFQIRSHPKGPGIRTSTYEFGGHSSTHHKHFSVPPGRQAVPVPMGGTGLGSRLPLSVSLSPECLGKGMLDGQLLSFQTKGFVQRPALLAASDVSPSCPCPQGPAQAPRLAGTWQVCVIKKLGVVRSDFSRAVVSAHWG